MSRREDIEELIDAAQPNPLLRLVDGLCASRVWDDLVELRKRCVQAAERGKQLWAIAEHIDYRLALEAPGAYAAGVLTPGGRRFVLGPLTEVAASSHEFAELVEFIPTPQAAGMFAAERVVRGEALVDADEKLQEIVGLPMALQSWEPEYPLAVYRAHKAQFPDPTIDAMSFEEGMAARGDVLDDAEIERALLDLVTAWLSESGGEASCAIVDGSAQAAIGAAGIDQFRLRQISGADAISLMAWAAASGGAHGRRRGAAIGRFGAWWAAAALADLEWPPTPALLGSEVEGLTWFQFEPPGGNIGWNLHLAVESPAYGWSAAISAADRMQDELVPSET